jgi:tetratricopeptide (TPR) repeat protein
LKVLIGDALMKRLSLNKQREYDRAVIKVKKALERAEKTYGPNHPEVATSLDNLALLYYKQFRYAQAEPLTKRALSILEKAFGSDHPDVGEEMNNLAMIYDRQGRCEQAEPLYIRLLSIREKALGPEHPYVAESLNGLAELYAFQGRYAKAEPLYKRALAIREKVFGPNHPNLVMLLEDLASLYRKTSREKEAKELKQRAASILPFEKRYELLGRWDLMRSAHEWFEALRSNTGSGSPHGKDSDKLTRDESIIESIWLMSYFAAPKQQWQFILAAVSQAESDDELWEIAAGPVGTLLSGHGEEVIERIEQQAAKDSKFARMLTGVWKWGKMKKEIWLRVRILQANVKDPLDIPDAKGFHGSNENNLDESKNV